MAAARFLVGGVVQGVFYRASTRDQALRLGLTGHARNLPDGCVEVVAHGDAAAVDALERWLWQGSAAAQVERVERSGVDDAAAAPRGFSTG
ncbi:acylphosphatase [Frateuria sp.]|uniref:acylphosphatase n=1 Tax=Frateuria sp. TaxID=2211372 RepID=UPI00180CF721|nr:acylphosphatase [Frateuria sp.]NUR23348.1 acylphosphatase [Frateuria sp.]